MNGNGVLSLRIVVFVIGLCSLVLAGCDASQTSSGVTPIVQADGKPVRWYSSKQVQAGGRLYARHCTDCHGKQGEGAADWRKPEPDGKYPPPPLNGTGHAWHHPMQLLAKVIREGSPPDQGKMPPWGDKLKDDEIISIIAWFQSHWSDPIYTAWLRQERRQQKRS